MRAARTDSNHAEIVKAFRDAGATVQDLSAVGKGCPDLLIGYRGLNGTPLNFLCEIKDGSKPPSKRVLTADQKEWHATWAGQVVVAESIEGAIEALVAAAKACGKL